MELIAICADAADETRFRRSEIACAVQDFAPPSAPIRVSGAMTAAHARFLIAPPGWDRAFHPSPRRQLAVLLEGEATVTATDGETIAIKPGDVLLLDDQGSRGHLTAVRGDGDARFLLVGLGA